MFGGTLGMNFDPFRTLGLAFTETHPGVKHCPYRHFHEEAFEPRHLSFIQAASAIVLVLCEPTDQLRASDAASFTDPRRSTAVSRDLDQQIRFAREVRRVLFLGDVPLRMQTGRVKPMIVITIGELEGPLAAGYGVEEFSTVAHMLYRNEDYLEMAELVFERYLFNLPPATPYGTRTQV